MSIEIKINRIGHFHSNFLNDVKKNSEPELYEFVKKIFTIRDSRKISSNSLSEREVSALNTPTSLALLCARKEPVQTARNIQKFKVTDQRDLVDIAKVCLAHGSYRSVPFLKNFGIIDQSKLAALVLECAKKKKYHIAMRYDFIGITDLNLSFAIAKECAKYSPLETIYNLDKFKVTDQNLLVKIVLECAKRAGWDTSLAINDLDIKNKEDILKIALECAKHSAEGVASNIQNFKGLNQEDLAQVAIACAKKNGLAIAQYIQNFGITDEKMLTEIAKVCAKQNGGGTSAVVRNFGIKNTEVLQEIAYLCVSNGGLEFARNVGNFSIEDQKVLEDLATACADQSPSSIIWYLSNFKIENYEKRVELIKLSAKKEPVLTMHYIKHLGITEQKDLVSLALITAEKNPTEILYHIRNFRIKSDEDLFKAGMLSAKGDPENTAKMLTSLGIKDSMLRTKLMIECGTRDIKLYSLVFEKYLEDDDLRTNGLKELYSYAVNLPLKEKNLEKVKEVVSKIASHPLHTLKETGPWLVMSLHLMKGLEDDELNWVIDQGLWGALGNLRSTKLRSKLTKKLFNLVKNKKFRELFTPFFDSTKSRWAQLSLVSISLYSFHQHKVDVVTLMQYLESKKSRFKDVYHTRLLLETFQLLEKAKHLSNEEKVIVLKKIFYDSKEVNISTPKEILRKTLAVRAFLKVKSTEWIRSDEDLESLMFKLFRKHLPLKKFTGDLPKAIQEIYGPNSVFWLFIYADRLLQEKESTLLKCYNDYLESVFKGTFKETRYQTRKNPHLKMLFKANPKLIRNWKRKDDETFDLGGSTLKVLLTDDPRHLLFCGTDIPGSCQRLDDEVLNKGLLGYLMNGQNLLLAVTSNEKIVSRSLLRLLWDGKGPVLYLDTIYPKSSTKEQDDAIIRMAKKRASELGLPLTSYLGKKRYKRSLSSLGGQAPYDYADHGGGLSEKSRFTIKFAYLI